LRRRWRLIAGGGAGILAFWRYVYFFRDPHRTPPSGENVVAPADGRVVYVRQFSDQVVPIAVKKRRQIALHELAGTPLQMRAGHVIGIYLSPWDVHVNRSPIAGVVDHVVYRPSTANRSMALFGIGALVFRHISPRLMGHVVENERNSIGLRGDLDACVVQIADFYVRKVRCSVREGQMVDKGERIGSIVMGSQVDLVLADTDGLRIEVEEGDRVRAGETVVATYGRRPR
jgi:phosphatidylserine decarboxylase